MVTSARIFKATAPESGLATRTLSLPLFMRAPESAIDFRPYLCVHLGAARW